MKGGVSVIKFSKAGRFRQRVSDETLGSRDGFKRVLNHDPLDGGHAEQLLLNLFIMIECSAKSLYNH